MAKLESFASLDITGFQRSLKKLGDEVNAFERQLSKKKFEIDLSINTKALDNLGKVGFDRIANNFKQLESAMRRISDIKLSFTPFKKLVAVSKGLGETTNQLASLSKTLTELKSNNFTFNTKAFQDLSKVNLDAITKQITGFMNSMKSLGSANFSVNLSELQKLSTLNLGNITTQLSGFAASVKSLNGIKLNIGLTGIQALSSLNIQNVLTQIPQLAKALKSLEGINVNLNLKSLNDIAKLDVSRVTQALNQLIPTLQKLNGINVNIQLPTTGVNQISQLGQSFGLYSNYARSFAGAIGLISPQMSSMFYWTGRVAESMGLYNTTTTLGKFNTIALVTSIGALIGVLIALGATAVEQGQKLENAFAILKANGVETLKAVKTSLEAIRDTDISTARRGLADYAEALANLTRAGQTGAEGLEILKQASFLASAEGTNLSDTAIELTRNLLQFQMTAKDAARAVDSLTLASNDAVGTQSDLSKGLNTVGAIAKQAGFSFEETLAALVQLDNKGLSAADKGATALRNVLAAATSPTVAFRNAAKQLGVDLVDSAGKTRQGRDIIFDLVHVLSNARVTYDELTGEIRGNADAVAAASTLFRTRGFAAILSLSDGVEGLANKYRDGKGAAQDYAETLSKTFTGSLDQLKASAKDAGTNLFQLVGPSLVAGLKAATAVVGGFRDVLNTLSSTPAFTQSLLALGAAALFISNASKLAAVGVAAYNTVTALAIPLGQAGIVTLAGTNIAFARLSLSAKLAAVSVGLFQKASALLVLNPVIATATAAFVALGGAIAFATKNYEDMAAASEKQIEKNTQFLESLKKARAEGNRVSPELGNLRAREVVQLDKVKTLGQSPDTSVKEIQDAIASLNKTRAEIQAELKKYAVDTASTFSVSDETQKSIDALNERAQSTALRFKEIKDQGLDKTFLDISAGIRELIKGLDDIPEISGNAKAYQAYVDKFTALENNLKAAAVDKAVIDAKAKNADDFAAIEKEKTSILKDQSQKRKLELEQELKDLETKYNKQIELARKNLQQAQQSKNANPSQIADLSSAVTQSEKNKSEAIKVARQKEAVDQKVIEQQRVDKEAEVNNKIVALRQQSINIQLELLKNYGSVVEKQYASELDIARDNVQKKIDIDAKYREKILSNTKRIAEEQAKVEKSVAKQQLEATLRDASKVDNTAQRGQIVQTAKANYSEQIKSINIKYAEQIRDSEISFDKQVSDHRRALNETYYKTKLDQQRALYENETRFIDTLSAKELKALQTKLEAESKTQATAGNSRSASLINEFAKKVKDQQQSNLDEFTRKTPELIKGVEDTSKQLNAAINNQDNSLSKFIDQAAGKYLSVVEKAKEQMQQIKDLIDRAGVATPAQQALLTRLQGLIDQANSKAEQAKTAAANLYQRNLNDNAADRTATLAGRTYDKSQDAKAYEQALSLYEDYWKRRLEIAKQNQDPQERAAEVSSIEDKLNEVYDRRNQILADQKQIREQALKLDIESLQYQLDSAAPEGQKTAILDAILERMREQLKIQLDILKNPSSEKERLDALAQVLQLNRDIDGIVQKRVQVELDGLAQQKESVQALISLKQAEINLQSKTAVTDSQVLNVYQARIDQSKEQVKIYKDEISALGTLRDKYLSLAEAAQKAGDVNTAGSYKASAAQIVKDIAQRNVDVVNEQANSIDLQKQKQEELFKIQTDELQTKEAILKAQDAIAGKSRDAVETARTDLKIAEERRRVAEERLSSLPSNSRGLDSAAGRSANKDVSTALQQEAEARKNLAEAELSSANQLLDREEKRRKLALDISGIGNDQVENAKIEIDIAQRKLALIAEELRTAQDLVSYGKAYQDYQDKFLEIQKQKNELVKLEADLRFKDSNDQNERDLRIAQARLALTTQAGDEVAAQTIQINAAVKSLEILRARRLDFAPGSNAGKDNEVAILEQEGKILTLNQQKVELIANQRRASIDLLNAQLVLEARQAGYGQDSVEAIRIQASRSSELVDVLKTQLQATSSKVAKEQLMKQLYDEQLNLLNLQDAKAKSIADNRKLSLDQSVSARELSLVASGQNTAANQAQLNLATDAELVGILQEQLATTSDINEKKRISIQINQVLKKQYEDQKSLQDAGIESQRASIDIQYAKAQLSLLQAGYDEGSIESLMAQIAADEQLVALAQQKLALATNNDDRQKAELDLVNAQIKAAQDRARLEDAQKQKIIKSMEQQTAIAQAQLALSAAISGAEKDIVKSAQQKLLVDQMDLAVANTKLAMAKNQEERNAALITVLQKQADIRRDMSAIEDAIYSRQKSQLDLQNSQIQLLEKQASVNLKLQGSDGNTVLDAQLAINSAISERAQKLKEIELLDSKPARSIDEQIANAKERNQLQSQYLDAIAKEVDARKQLRDAEINDIRVREQLANAQFNLGNALSYQPSGIDSGVIQAQRALSDANRTLSQAGNMANEILSKLSNNGQILASDVSTATNAISQMTSAIQSQRSALDSLAKAYEDQIQNAITLSKSVMSAQQVFSAAAEPLTKSNAREQMAVYEDLINSASQLKTQLATRLSSLLKDSTATAQMISSALNDLTSAEQDRQGFVKNFNSAAEAAGSEIKKSISDGFGLDPKVITLARKKASEIAKAEEEAKKARQDAINESQNNLANALNLFVKTFQNGSPMIKDLSSNAQPKQENRDFSKLNDPSKLSFIDNNASSATNKKLAEDLAKEYLTQQKLINEGIAIDNRYNAEAVKAIAIQNEIRAASAKEEVAANQALYKAKLKEAEVNEQIATNKLENARVEGEISKAINQKKIKNKDNIAKTELETYMAQKRAAEQEAKATEKIATARNIRADMEIEAAAVYKKTEADVLKEYQRRFDKYDQATVMAADRLTLEKLKVRAPIAKLEAEIGLARESVNQAEAVTTSLYSAAAASQAMADLASEQARAAKQFADRQANLSQQILEAEKAELEARKAMAQATKAEAEYKERYAGRLKNMELDQRESDLAANIKINEERVKQAELATEILRQQLKDTKGRSGDNTLAGVTDAIKRILEANKSWSDAAQRSLRDYTERAIDILRSIKDEISKPDTYVPQSPTPSTPERSGLQPVDNSKTVNFNFGDITQNVNTQSVAPEDVPKLWRNIKILIKNEFENLGGGC